MQLPFLEIHNIVLKFFILIQGIYMKCLIHLGHVLCSALKDLKTLFHICNSVAYQQALFLFKSDYNKILFDFIAPNTQNIELQDQAEGTEDLHPGLNENYDLSDDLGIPSTSFNREPLLLNELPDDDYREMFQTLNKKLKAFFIMFCIRLKPQISHFIAL